MMNCPSCGAEVIGSGKFCSECGQRLPAAPKVTAPVLQTCPGCGLQWQPDVRFCGGCAHSFCGEEPRQPVPSVCPSCQAPITGKGKFCSECGTRLPQPETCAKCGHVSRAGARYCGGCGQSLTAGPAAKENAHATGSIASKSTTVEPVSMPVVPCEPFRLENPSMMKAMNRPHSIVELENWCRMARIPDLHTIGFCIGETREPGFYAIARESSSWLVYRIRSNGERVIYYAGQHEDFAVNGFWHTLGERLGVWDPNE